MSEKFTINDRVYGQWELSDPLALSLIRLPEFQRLYHVGQYGSYWFGLPEANTNRAEHSLGVYFLLRHFGRPHEECIAGLLHDVSHTVFSHVIDYVHGDSVNQETQDGRHAALLAQSGFRRLLDEAELDHRAIAELEAYPVLDRSLPDLCADRLDYMLRDSVCYGELTLEEARGILSHIVLVGDVLAVDDADVARFLVRHSVMMTKQHWGPPFGCFIFHRTADALKRATALGIISHDDLYTTDRVVWDKMKSGGDAEILLALSDVENIKMLNLCLDPENYEYRLRSKFRAIDPMVRSGNRLVRATELFPELVEYLAEERERYEAGYPVRVVRA